MTQYRHFKQLRILLIAAALLVGAAAGARLLWAGEVYTVYVASPGELPDQVGASGRFESVAEVLASAGIAVREADVVTPPLDQPPLPSIPIQVNQALSITVRTDAGTTAHWTHQATIGPFLRELQLSVRRTDRVFADGVIVTFANLEQAPLPASLEIGRFTNLTIRDGSRELALRTSGQTVGDALAEAGITVYAADGVRPAMSEWVTPDMVVTVQRSMPLVIHADGRIMQTRSHNTNVLDVLAEAGIGLVGADYTQPGPGTALRSGDTIVVVRVTEDFRVVDSDIPFASQWQGTDQLEIDNFGLLQAGVPGIQRQRIRVRNENGVEVSQRVDGEWLAREPVPEIIGFGTQIVIRTLQTEDGPREYWRKVRMRVTSYTAATSGKTPDHPAYGITRSGLPAGRGIVAVDPTVVPWLSTVYVEGYGEGLAGDTGGGVKGRWIDLGYPEDDFPHWAGYVDVYYLTPVPPTNEINYLLPRTLP